MSPSVQKRGPALSGAIVLLAAVALQAGLGVWTLLWRVPLAIALIHQAMAMLVLTAATAHAAAVAARVPRVIAAAARA